MRLGVAPDDSHLWLCHVDVVARALVLLAGAADLNNETHHLENARMDTLAGFVTGAEGVRACRFDAFLDRLEAAVDEPAMDAALTETMENFGLYRGFSPQARARRLEIVSERTRCCWPGWACVASSSGCGASGNVASGGPAFLRAVIHERGVGRDHLVLCS